MAFPTYSLPTFPLKCLKSLQASYPHQPGLRNYLLHCLTINYPVSIPFTNKTLLWDQGHTGRARVVLLAGETENQHQQVHRHTRFRAVKGGKENKGQEELHQGYRNRKMTTWGFPFSKLKEKGRIHLVAVQKTNSKRQRLKVERGQCRSIYAPGKGGGGSDRGREEGCHPDRRG